MDPAGLYSDLWSFILPAQGRCLMFKSPWAYFVLFLFVSVKHPSFLAAAPAEQKRPEIQRNWSLWRGPRADYVNNLPALKGAGLMGPELSNDNCDSLHFKSHEQMVPSEALWVIVAFWGYDISGWNSIREIHFQLSPWNRARQAEQCNMLPMKIAPILFLFLLLFAFCFWPCSHVTSSHFHSLLSGDSRAFKNKTQHLNKSGLYRITQLPCDSLENSLSPRLTFATSTRKTAQSHCEGETGDYHNHQSSITGSYKEFDSFLFFTFKLRGGEMYKACPNTKA